MVRNERTVVRQVRTGERTTDRRPRVTSAQLQYYIDSQSSQSKFTVHNPNAKA
jgi:hypothetical protein